MGAGMRSRKWLALSKARFAALQALYQWEQRSDELSLDDVVSEFWDFRLTTKDYQPVDDIFFSKILSLWSLHQADIDTYIAQNLSEDWRIERLASPLRALLRLVVTEIKHFQTPAPVVWSEYQELAQAFIDESDIPFVMRFMGTLLPETQDFEPGKPN